MSRLTASSQCLRTSAQPATGHHIDTAPRRTRRVASWLAATALLGASAEAPVRAAAVTLTATPAFTCASATDPTLGGTLSWFEGARSAVPTLGLQGVAATPLDCANGQFSEPVERKPKDPKDTDILIVTMKEVLTTSASRVRTWREQRDVVGELIDGVQYFETYWDIFEETPAAGNFAPAPGAFVGVRFISPTRFVGQVLFTYEESQADGQTIGELRLEVPLQDADNSRLELTSTPRPTQPVPEPGTMTLVAVGGMGMFVILRRRRETQPARATGGSRSPRPTN